MGHSSVLVIGDNAQDQFDKFQRAEYAHPTQNKYLIEIDVLEQAKAEYMGEETKRFLRDKDGQLHNPWDAKFWRKLADDEAEEVPVDAPLVTRISLSDGSRAQLHVPADFRLVDVPIHDLMSFQDFVKKQVRKTAGGYLADGGFGACLIERTKLRNSLLNQAQQTTCSHHQILPRPELR